MSMLNIANQNAGASMAVQGRYLVGQKISDYQVEKILRSFAHGIQASDALKSFTAKGKPTFAPNTVFRIYDLARKRLLEIGYFPEPSNVLEWAQSSSEIADGFAFGTAQRLQVERLRGASDESVRFHLAEIFFRAENEHMSPEGMASEIIAAIRMTGPLNRPPRDLDLWQERQSMNLYQRHIDKLRRMRGVPPDHLREFVAGYEQLIKGAQQRLRKRMRERSIIQKK